MNVLMQSRENLFELPGGDTIQLLNTKSELEKLGINVDISLELEPDLSKYDIVHLFNITRIQETYRHVKNAKRQNKPIVLSTIFWPMDFFEKNGQFGIRSFINKRLGINNIERLKAFARFFLDTKSRNSSTFSLISVGYRNMQNYVITNSDIYLPNAEIEMDELCKYFSVPKKDYVVVPNAVSNELVNNTNKKTYSDKFQKYHNYVICVGRIEPRKNQLSLVKALDGSGLPLLLVGAVSNNQKKYFESIKFYLDRNPSFKYIEHIDNNDMYSLFSVCKTSCLPSWLDTPGLVSLEAAAMGCSLAISTKGSTLEYFGDDAFYCEPNDLESIRNAVLNAYNCTPTQKLKEKVLNCFTWEKAAKMTLIGYQKALEKYNI